MARSSSLDLLDSIRQMHPGLSLISRTTSVLETSKLVVDQLKVSDGLAGHLRGMWQACCWHQHRVGMDVDMVLSTVHSCPMLCLHAWAAVSGYQSSCLSLHWSPPAVKGDYEETEALQCTHPAQCRACPSLCGDPREDLPLWHGLLVNFLDLCC